MNCYERLVCDAEQKGLYVIEKEFKSAAKGLCKGNKIGISSKLNSAVEKRCVLAEEMAHAFFTIGNILDQSDLQNRKQEVFARRQAFEALLPLSLLVDAYKYGCRLQHEIADYLEVTEEFLLDSLYHYQTKYGLYAKYKKYIIYFSPLIVCEKVNNIFDIA